MRSDLWLEERMENIWGILMPEIEKQNIVRIRFNGNSKNRFGHIQRLRDGSTLLTINSLFRHEQVPTYIIDTTIAHELVHYMHGFHSPLPRRYRHPHKGGIVNKELKSRGFDFLLRLEKNWIKNQWWTTYSSLKSGIS